MYSPLNEDLMFQQMNDRATALREARALGKARPSARRRWRTSLAERASRRTR